LEASGVGSNGIDMNILEQTKKFYDELGLDMFKDITMYLGYGYVFKTPDSLLLGKAVRTDDKTHPSSQWNVKDPDAWYVHMAIGKVGIAEFIKRIPYELPYVGWMRHFKNKPVKFYDFKRISRRK